MATFYTQYKRHPNGTYTVGVCTNTLCAIMGGDAIWEDLSDHLGVGHDETTEDGAITLERVECNAACDYAPVVMVNWEFFDNQTPDSARKIVDDLTAGAPVVPTRGAASVCSFKEMSRVLAGFDDGRADEGVGAGPATLRGVELARAEGWTAPEIRPDARRPAASPHRRRAASSRAPSAPRPPRRTSRRPRSRRSSPPTTRRSRDGDDPDPGAHGHVGRRPVVDARRATRRQAATAACVARSTCRPPTSSPRSRTPACAAAAVPASRRA